MVVITLFNTHTTRVIEPYPPRYSPVRVCDIIIQSASNVYVRFVFSRAHAFYIRVRIYMNTSCVPDQFLLSRDRSGGGRGSEDWPNGIGEPDRRRLADTHTHTHTVNTSRTMPSRAPLGRASVFFFYGVVRRVFLRPPSSQ